MALIGRQNAGWKQWMLNEEGFELASYHLWWQWVFVENNRLGFQILLEMLCTCLLQYSKSTIFLIIALKKKYNRLSCFSVSKKLYRTSLVAQWLRIRLPMQGTRVRALVQEDPTCHGATKPVRHNYWAYALEPTSHNYWARVLQLQKPTCPEPVLCNKRSHRNEKPAHHNKE